MTNIEKQALELVNEVFQERDLSLDSYLNRISNSYHEALCRAIERHEAFKREVSDAVVELGCWPSTVDLGRFVLPEPVDPFVALVGEAVWDDPNEPDAVDCAASILAALAARGLKIVEVGHD